MKERFNSIIAGIASPFIAKKTGVSARYVREALALGRKIETLSPEEAAKEITAFFQANREEYERACAAIAKQSGEAK